MAKPNRRLPEITQQDVLRFWRWIDCEDPSGCWIWKKSVRNGYGCIKIKGRKISTHRLAYFLHYDDDPVGFLVCHTCDNGLCCNGHHLFKGTDATNLADARAKGRFPIGERHWTKLHPERIARGDRSSYALHPESYPRGDQHYSRHEPERLAWGARNYFFQRPQSGEKHPNAKFTDDQVKEIRARYAAGGISQYALATEYRVTRGCIASIIKRRLWKHL